MEERSSSIITGTHKISVNNRKNATITGVADVLAFDLNEVLLETNQGMLMIKGNDLHVKRLSLEKGEVDLEGKIDSFFRTSLSRLGPWLAGEIAASAH